jgi:transposase-like protein
MAVTRCFVSFSMAEAARSFDIGVNMLGRWNREFEQASGGVGCAACGLTPECAL